MEFLNMFYSFYWQGLRVNVNEVKKKRDIHNREMWKVTEYMIETDGERIVKEMVIN